MWVSRRYYQYTINFEHDILELIQLIKCDSTNASNNQKEQRKRQQRQMELLYDDFSEDESSTTKRIKYSNNNDNWNIVNRLALLINGCSETTSTSWYELAQTLLTFSSVSNQTNSSLQTVSKSTKQQSIFSRATILFNYNTIKYIDITCSNNGSELVHTIINLLIKPIVLSTLTKSILIEDTNDNRQVAQIRQHRTKELIVNQFTIEKCILLFSTTTDSSINTTTTNTTLAEVLSIPSLSFHNLEITDNLYSSRITAATTTTLTFGATTATPSVNFFPLVVKALQSNTVLRYLNLSKNKLRGINTATAISNMLYWNTSIQNLDLSSNQFLSNELVLIFKSVQYHPALQVLDITYDKSIINNTNLEFEDMFLLLKYNEILLKLYIDGWRTTSTKILTMLLQCMKYNNTIQEISYVHGFMTFEICRKKIREYLQERSLLLRDDMILHDDTLQREIIDLLDVRDNMLPIEPALPINNFLLDLFGDVVPDDNFVNIDTNLQENDIFNLIASPYKGRLRRNDTFHWIMKYWGRLDV